MIGPEKLYPEHQGESLGWGRDGRERNFPTGSCMLLGEVLSLGCYSLAPACMCALPLDASRLAWVAGESGTRAGDFIFICVKLLRDHTE